MIIIIVFILELFKGLTVAKWISFHQLYVELAEQFPIAKEMVFVGPKKYCVRKKFQSIAGNLYNFKTRPSDVWIYGYPRSGTTMTQEITWLIGNDLDYETAAQKVLDGVRYTYFEKEISMNSEFYDNIINNPTKYKDYVIPIAKFLRDPNWITLEKWQDKRFIKTHLPFSMGASNVLTSGCKIFYLARNPKDAIISRYETVVKNFLFNGNQSDEEFDHYWQRFKRGLAMWTPYFEHLKEGWEASKTNPNVMFLFYEDYKKDMRKTLVKIATHLDKKLTDQDLDKLEEHMKIENFRKNKSVNNDYFRDIGVMKDEPNRFIRNGKVGTWKEYLTESLNSEMDQWIEENLKSSGLTDFQFPNV